MVPAIIGLVVVTEPRVLPSLDEERVSIVLAVGVATVVVADIATVALRGGSRALRCLPGFPSALRRPLMASMPSAGVGHACFSWTECSTPATDCAVAVGDVCPSSAVVVVVVAVVAVIVPGTGCLVVWGGIPVEQAAR